MGGMDCNDKCTFHAQKINDKSFFLQFFCTVLPKSVLFGTVVDKGAVFHLQLKSRCVQRWGEINATKKVFVPEKKSGLGHALCQRG